MTAPHAVLEEVSLIAEEPGPGRDRLDRRADGPRRDPRSLQALRRRRRRQSPLFDIEPGRVTGFLGPNGAGKSTTLRALLGLVQPSSGSATFGGLRYDELDEPSARVGAVLEDASFHPGRSARNHLRVLARSRQTIPPAASRRSCPRSGSATPPTGV